MGVLHDFFKKHKWTVNAFARTKNGLSVGPKNDAAECFCLLGACTVLFGEGTQEYREYRNKIEYAIKTRTKSKYNRVAQFNDFYVKSKKYLLAFLRKNNL